MTVKGPRRRFGEECPGVASRLRWGADGLPPTAQGPWTATRRQVRRWQTPATFPPLAGGGVPSAPSSSPATAFRSPRTENKVPFRRPAPSTNVAAGSPRGHARGTQRMDFSRRIWYTTLPRVHGMRFTTGPEDLVGFKQGAPHVRKHLSGQLVSCPSRHRQRHGDRTCAFPNEFRFSFPAPRPGGPHLRWARRPLPQRPRPPAPPPPRAPPRLRRPCHRTHSPASLILHPTALPRRVVPGSIPLHPKALHTSRGFQAPSSP